MFLSVCRPLPFFSDPGVGRILEIYPRPVPCLRTTASGGLLLSRVHRGAALQVQGAQSQYSLPDMPFRSRNDRKAGIGAFIEEDEGGRLFVSSVAAGGPSHGILVPGDVLISVVLPNDGAGGSRWAPVVGLSVADAQRLILGSRGATVSLVVERHGRRRTVDVVQRAHATPSSSPAKGGAHPILSDARDLLAELDGLIESQGEWEEDQPLTPRSEGESDDSMEAMRQRGGHEEAWEGGYREDHRWEAGHRGDGEDARRLVRGGEDLRGKCQRLEAEVERMHEEREVRSEGKGSGHVCAFAARHVHKHP